MNSLSALHRPQYWQRLTEEPFDLIVVGGGVTGAGIALDAATRGMKTALLEKHDFASGTSSRSTKLIHGGLRYLKQLEIGLVREVGRERAIVHRLAPHLVRPEKMLLPLIEGGTYGKLATSLGLLLYDFLADVEGDDRRKMLDRDETLDQEPLLRAEGLLGGGLYAEYRTDDARLTIELIKQAVRSGALCLNYSEVTGFQYRDEKVVGVQCTDRLSGADGAIQGAYVVSAAGPWVDDLRRIDHSLQGKHLFLSKGVHLVVPHHRLPLKQAVYFDVPDGRMMFAIPRHRATYLGTTDTAYEGKPEEVTANRQDAEYILQGANAMFPLARLTLQDVESSWAGLRPLIYEEGKSPSEMSRRDEIFESDSGLLSIAGGKLTGYRKMADRIVDLVAERFQQEHDRRFPESATKDQPLGEEPFGNIREVREYERRLDREVQVQGLPAYRTSYLTENYGRQSSLILEKMGNFPDEDPETRLARAEAWYGIHHELCCTALDLFNRRTGRLYFDHPGIGRVQQAVLQDLAEQLNWSAEQLEAETAALERAKAEAATFE